MTFKLFFLLKKFISSYVIRHVPNGKYCYLVSVVNVHFLFSTESFSLFFLPLTNIHCNTQVVKCFRFSSFFFCCQQLRIDSTLQQNNENGSVFIDHRAEHRVRFTSSNFQIFSLSSLLLLLSFAELFFY